MDIFDLQRMGFKISNTKKCYVLGVTAKTFTGTDNATRIVVIKRMQSLNNGKFYYYRQILNTKTNYLTPIIKCKKDEYIRAIYSTYSIFYMENSAGIF